MAWSSDDDRLEDLLRSLELKSLDKGEILYRGSFDGRQNEEWSIPCLSGVKSLTHEKSYALKYAQRYEHNRDYPLGFVPPEGAKGIIFCVEIIEPCKILEFPEDGKIYEKYVRHPLSGSKDFLEFERNCLMPIMRNAWGDDISGYIAPNEMEVLLDLDSIKFKLTAQEV